ncbi:hypothetical protein [Azonexus sp.]|uniref:hypothetical protein n=1 Tax=Azonexus sp. TaxID=1872668 RepID=UPI0039E37409
MEQKNQEKKKFDWGTAIDIAKTGLEFAEKVVGGRNILIASAAGLALGVAVGAITASPSESACKEYTIKQQDNNEQFKEWLRKRNSWG